MYARDCAVLVYAPVPGTRRGDWPRASPVRDLHGGDTGCGTSSGCPPSRSSSLWSSRHAARARPARRRPPQRPPRRPPRRLRPVERGSECRSQRGQHRPRQGIDDGTKISMWTRAATEARVRPLVTAYNASHKNQIELTVTPTDDYQAKVGAAAGSNGLPDLFSADVVFMPNWTSQGLFQDITSRIAGLPVRGQDRPGAHQGVDLGWQAIWPPIHRRPVRLALQQGPVSQGRPRPGEAPDDAPGIR